MVMGFPFRSCQYLLLILLVSICSLTVTHTLASPSFPSQLPCHAHERTALLQFKHSFLVDCAASGLSPSPYPKVKSWTRDEANGDCCSWDGVKCNEETGHVIGLDLTSSCLYGTFPRNSSLFILSHLEVLSLTDNDFNQSQIPSEVGQLNKLQYLDLSNSEFFGQIPLEISRLSELSHLDLSNNLVQSGLKLENPSLERLVRNLTHLNGLYLNTIDISSPVPTILANLTSLTTIIIQSCNLYGELPKSIFRLPRLQVLAVSQNPGLEGSLPEFQHNSPLKLLSLSLTSISGEVPPSIGNLAHLEVLQLMHCGLTGHIPSSLGNLTKLTDLQLSFTAFSGDIPSSLTNLTQLQVLKLSDLNVKPEKMLAWLFKLNKLYNLSILDMNLAGDIPSFLANLTSLTLLNLSGNQLTGQIPSWLTNLTQLQWLDLSENQLTGPIPQGISQLANLSDLRLHYNNFNGTFEALPKLKYLNVLYLSGVKLTFPAENPTNESFPKLEALFLEYCNLTEFPQFLGSQDELGELYLGHNSIHGLIPQWFMNVTRDGLYHLELDFNSITGFEQPAEALQCSHLQVLYLSWNKIQGSIPVPPNFIEIYDVSHNLFDGGIPEQICHAASLSYLDISSNNLGGRIPECMSELGVSLSILNLQGNNFHGMIPRAYPKSCKLKMISLSQNQLKGTLPRSLANCAMLEVLDIGNNHVNDTFPTWLRSLPNLQILVLQHNNFHGTIGRSISNVDFHSLRIIDLSHNFHTGDLPSDYFQKWDAMKTTGDGQSNVSRSVITLTNTMQGFMSDDQPYDYSITITNKGNKMLYPKILNVFRVVDFSSNNFTGKIPNSIGELRGLQALNLSNNNLDGNIPSSLTNMRDLESLDLSNNLLSGDIPQGLAQQLTSLEVFNVSHNHLVGPIPQGKQFNTFDNSSYEGNAGLWGSPLSNKCGNVDDPPQQPSEDTSNNTEDESSETELIDWIIRSLGCVGGFAVGCAIGKYFTDQNHDWFIETFGIKRRSQPNSRVRTAPNRRS